MESSHLYRRYKDLRVHLAWDQDDARRAQAAAPLHHLLLGVLIGDSSAEVEQHAGADIPAEQLSHIREPLCATKASGLGLGLALPRRSSKSIMKHLASTANPDEVASLRYALPRQ